jgi:ABC-type amino acid transport substrate-binding protein
MVRTFLDESGKTQTKVIGYIPDLISHLQTRMGFREHLMLIPSNQSYNGLVDGVTNDEYDIVVADVTITAGRMKKVDFSSSIFDNSLRIIVREASVYDVDLLSYLRPFSTQLWITLLIATVYAGFLICLIEREHNEALRNQPMFPLIIKSMWYSIGTILGYGADFTVQTAAGRLLTVGLYILSLVSVAAYTAKLASDLTIAKTKGIISGIEDIKNGKLSFSRIGILSNTSVEEYYLREISLDNRNFYPLISEDEMYEKLLNNIIDASIMDSGVLEYFTNNIYCNLALVGTDFDKNAFGIVFPKNWIYQQLFDVNILSLRESGMLD